MTAVHEPIEGILLGHAGMRLFMQAWQPAHTQAVLILAHGLGEHSGRYPNLVGELTKRGYAIYAVDHRGHGRSPGQRGYIETWEDLRGGVRALHQYAAAQHPGLPIFLMGHSLGGLIALEYAERDSTGLQGVIASAPGLTAAGLSPVLVGLSKLLAWLAPTISLKTGLPLAGISRDPAVQQAYLADPLNHHAGTPRLASESFAAMDWTNAHAGDLKLPLLIVHGEADPIVPLASSATYFAQVGSADKHRITYPDVVHEPHNDLGWQRPVGDIADWLDAHLSVRAQ